MFALNAGLVAFQDQLRRRRQAARSSPPPTPCWASAASCLQDSGLISKDSADVGARLSAIDMNRDDKAHRFVVTWNAFLDGNRLAYLALMLAIGVDALVFMSGLFGAQALRSPLSDVPSPKARSAHQLRGHHRGGPAARHLQECPARRSMPCTRWQPATASPTRDRARRADPQAPAVRDVLNAGATIGAVRQSMRRPLRVALGAVRIPLAGRQEVVRGRSSHVSPGRAGAHHGGIAAARRSAITSKPLLPLRASDRGSCRTILHKIGRGAADSPPRSGSTRSSSSDKQVVRNVLTAGAACASCSATNNTPLFHSRRDFYKTLARIRARLLAGWARTPCRSRRPAAAPPAAQRLPATAATPALLGSPAGSAGEPRRLMLG